MFEKFMKQELILTKKNLNVIDGIKASVQDKIYINDVKLFVEEGDVFTYILPSGLEQKLFVTKVTLFNIGSPLDHYEIEYKKSQN